LLVLPSVSRVKKVLPGVKITLACERRNEQAAIMSGAFDEIMAYDANPIRFLWRLWRRRYDAVVDSEQFHYASALFCLISGAMVRIGFKITPARNECYTHLIDYPMDLSEVQVFDKLVEPLIGTAAAPLEIVGFLDRSKFPLHDRIKDKLHKVGWPDRPVIAVFPHAAIREKQWGNSKFLELIHALTEKMDYSVVLIGGSDGYKTAQTLLAGSNPARVTSIVGETSFADTAGLLAVCKAYVGTDTGSSHLAIALNVPSVVLFGPSDERKWGAKSDRHASVHVKIPCRPCSIFGYIKLCRTVDCMALISVDDVLNELNQVMKNSSKIT